MHTFSLAMFTAWGAGLLAQAPQAPDAAGKTPSPTVAAATVANASFLAVDATADRLWAAGPGYKAAFDARGVEFHASPGADAPRSVPVHFALRSVHLAGEPLPVATATPTHEGALVTFARGSCAERYELREDGLEQTFTFASLPARGALQVALAATSEFAATAAADGLEWRGEGGGVRYGAAVAIDGKGERCPVAEELRGGELLLTVPAAFVANATLPLVIDPLIGVSSSVHTNARAVTATDLAWLQNRGEYWLCFERQFTATDIDVYVQRCSSALAPIGSPIAIDVSTTSWRHARMASLDQFDRCLVVAEQSTGNVSPFVVLGRIVAGGATPAALPAFDIQRAGAAGHSSYEGFHPDVCGDPGGGATAAWHVVWESAFSATDHDVKTRTVSQNGTLGPIWIDLDTSPTFEHDPVCSKSNGSGWMSSKFTGVAWRRDLTAGQGITCVGFVDDAGAFVSSTPVGGANVVTADGWSISSPLAPDFGSPQPGAPYLLAVSVVDPATQVPHIQCTALSPQGSVLAAPMPILSPAYASTRPRVSCDSVRFCVTWQTTFSTSPADEDVWAATVAYGGGQLYLQDTTLVGGFNELDLWPCTTTLAEGGEVTKTPRAAIAWAHSLPNGTFELQLASFQTTATNGGISVRPTGCGSLGIQAGGTGALGTAFSVQLTNPAGLAGFVFGAPTNGSIPICPMCTQGVSGDTMLSTGFGWGLPMNPALVGATIAFQGFDFGMGPCLGMIRLTDTVDLRVR